MSIPNYYLRGPIESGDRLFIATLFTYNNYTDLYWLQKIGTDYIFTPVLSINLPVLFTVSQAPSTTNGVVLYDGNGYLGINQNSSCKCLAASFGTSQSLAPVAQGVAPWGLFLSGVNYTISGMQFQLYPWQERNKINNCLPSGADTTDIQLTPTFHVVPMKWYAANNSCQVIPSAYTAYANEIAWYYNQSCAGTNILQQLSSLLNNISPSFAVETGFTDLSDCQNGLFYNYCPPGGTCGGDAQTGCAGPCSQSGTTCEYQKSSDQFTCVTPSSGGISIWAIVIIVIIVIIIIIVVFILLVVFIIILAKASKPSPKK